MGDCGTGDSETMESSQPIRKPIGRFVLLLETERHVAFHFDRTEYLASYLIIVDRHAILLLQLPVPRLCISEREFLVSPRKI